MLRLGEREYNGLGLFPGKFLAEARLMTIAWVSGQVTFIDPLKSLEKLNGYIGKIQKKNVPFSIHHYEGMYVPRTRKKIVQSGPQPQVGPQVFAGAWSKDACWMGRSTRK